MFLGKRLRELREEKGLYQDQLGDSIGVSKQTISFYESGRRVPDRTKGRKCERRN